MSVDEKKPCKLRYRELEGYEYDLDKCVTYPTSIPGIVDTKYLKLKKGVLSMLKGYAWDGPSGPTIDTKSFMRGSLIHDALYQLMREGYIDRKKWRKEADLLLRKICLEDGMSKFRAWYVYHSVRMFAEKSSFPRKKLRGQIVEIY